MVRGDLLSHGRTSPHPDVLPTRRTGTCTGRVQHGSRQSRHIHVSVPRYVHIACVPVGLCFSSVVESVGASRLAVVSQLTLGYNVVARALGLLYAGPS